MRGRAKTKRCPTRKTRFTSYKKAVGRVHQLPDEGRPYYCPKCGGYHVTSSSQAEYDRRVQEFLPPREDGTP